MSDDPYARDQPIVWWLKHLDGLLTVSFERLLEAEGLGVAHWRALNAVAGGAGGTGEVEAAFSRLGVGDPADAREAVSRLVTSGWLGADGGRLTLTPAGAEGRERLLRAQAGQHARLASGIAPEDYRTTIATLRRMARNLGQ